jgi:hypothetical protein
LGFCGVKNDWEGSGFGYTGAVDYMLGSSKTKSVESMKSCLLVTIARKEWPDSAVPHVLSEAGCLLKKRLAAGKKLLYLLFLPMDFSFASLPLTLMVLCILLETNSFNLGKTEPTIQAPLYLRFFAGSLGL